MGGLDGLPAEVPCGVMVAIPADADLDIGIMNAEHYQGLGRADRTRWLSVVAESGLFRPITGTHVRYHPQAFPFKVFTVRPAAVLWVEEQLDEHEAG